MCRIRAGSAAEGLGTVCRTTVVRHAPREVQGLTVESADGTLVGLAHSRPFARPLMARVGCFVDDLLVASVARGTGVVDLLLAQLRQVAATNGWDVVRWTTAEDSYRARATYDRVATRTDRVTSEMMPTARAPGAPLRGPAPGPWRRSPW